MAFVVLFSTMSFTVSLHYCGESLVDAAIFKTAEDCGMKMESSHKNNLSITEKQCCLDKQLIVEGLDVLKDSCQEFAFKKYTTTAFLPTLEERLPFHGFNSYQNFLAHYKPPNIVKSIHELDEVYLI